MGDHDTNPFANIFSAFPPPQQFESLGRLCDIPYRPRTPHSYTPDIQAQENHQNVRAGTIRLSVPGGARGPLFLFSDLSSQELGTLGYPHENVLDTSVNYTGMEDDCFDYQYYTEFPQAPIADTPGFERGGSSSSIPRAQGSSVTGESYHSSQYSTAEQNYSFDPHDGEGAGSLDSEVAGCSYGQASGTHLDFGISQANSIVSDEAVVVEPTNPLLSSPAASTVGNKGGTQVVAESPPVDVGNLGIQPSGKRKRPASPDSGHEGKRTQRKKRRHSAARGQAQTTQTIVSLPTRPDFHMVEQTVYQSQNVQKDWQPLPSNGFTVVEEGEKLEGINLQDALNLRYCRLDGRDDLMFEDESIGNSISCRMEFVGHRVSKYKTRQITTKNHRKTHDRITRQRLAYDVAKLVKNYLERGEAPFHVRFEDMFLTKLHHVARASWQPEIWYRVRPSASF